MIKITMALCVYGKEPSLFYPDKGMEGIFTKTTGGETEYAK